MHRGSRSPMLKSECPLHFREGCMCVWFDPPVKRHHNWEIELHYPEGPDGEAEVCERSVAQSCPTLWDPMDCSPPGSSVHGILQARIQEWVSISYSRGSSPSREQTSTSLTHLAHWQAGSLPLELATECSSMQSLQVRTSHVCPYHCVLWASD